jgi:hypothetical protein
MWQAWRSTFVIAHTGAGDANATLQALDTQLSFAVWFDLSQELVD